MTHSNGVATNHDHALASESVAEAFDDHLVTRTLRVYRWLSRYAHLKVDGLERIPKGPAILVANHSGWAGLDYAFLALAIHDKLGRCPRALVHPAWFAARPVAKIARRLGLVRASMASFLELLRQGHLVVVFPEGEDGAFKQTFNRPHYEPRAFKDGFARAAQRTGAPVIPISIVGGEEAFPTWKPLALPVGKKRFVIPTPLSPLPLPSNWRIQIHAPARPNVSDDFVGTVRNTIATGCLPARDSVLPPRRETKTYYDPERLPANPARRGRRIGSTRRRNHIPRTTRASTQTSAAPPRKS